jgi:4-amino-4-deoxy-L-arabinose transferase-like glycosyltransferase
MIRSVRELVQKKARFFIGTSLAALSLRFLLVIYFPAIADDSRFYANIAQNWLQHGVYGITNSGVITPTLSRLPGYPAFLAVIFALFGAGNFRAVLLVQALFDLATCFLIADLARRLFSLRAAQAAFLLAALCPFLANYAAAALTETLEISFTALALDLAFRGLGVGETRTGVVSDATVSKTIVSKPMVSGPIVFNPTVWLGCGLSVGASILLRPDGGILLAAIGAYLLFLLIDSWRKRPDKTRFAPRTIIWAGVLVAVAAFAPLIPWTLRNLHTMHRFEPLAPRYATDSDDVVMNGFNRWVKTWIEDYVSVQEIYWSVPGSEIDLNKVPHRAFDSQPQRERATELFADYNRDHDMTPELDSRFAALAAERVQASPLRYYLWLPAVRIADMWLRPRTELFPSDPRWWEFNDDPRWLAVSLGFGVINLAYIVMAVAGLLRGREFFGIGLFVLFLLLRSVFLGTLENPEPRYTLECYPVVIVLASALFHRQG